MHVHFGESSLACASGCRFNALLSAGTGVSGVKTITHLGGDTGSTDDGIDGVCLWANHKLDARKALAQNLLQPPRNHAAWEAAYESYWVQRKTHAP
jgi:hypothetical protein